MAEFPTHTKYVEAFGGACSVLLNKPRCEVEIYNELDGGMVNLTRVVRDRCGEFIDRIKQLTFDKAMFIAARDRRRLPDFHTLPELDRAVIEYTVRRASFGGLCGHFKGSSISRRQDGVTIDVHTWATMIDALPITSARLQGVTIEQRDAIDLISEHDEAGTLIYSDSPYVHTTRSQPKAYTIELSDADHVRLAQVVTRMTRARVAVSGYRCDLYDDLYRGWRRIDRATRHVTSTTKRPAVECLWLNWSFIR